MKVIDWTGKSIEQWKFIRFVRKDKDGHRLWEARCNCGTVRVIRPMGESQSCGCIARGQRAISEVEMKGKQFGSLVALKPLGKRVGRDGVGRPYWLFRCLKCGEEVKLNKSGVIRGEQEQCPTCGRKRNIKHGAAGKNKAPEYMAYHNARQRCTNPKVREYSNYGGRGIKFLFDSFEEFLAEVGPKPTPKHSLDRFPDNNGNYEAGNLRWATPKEQLMNTRLHSLDSRSTEEITQEFLKRIESAGLPNHGPLWGNK